MRAVAPVLALAVLAACEGDNRPDKTQDRGLVGRTSLQDLTPGIWVDLNGCEHWMIDDGVEGYLTPRFDPRTGRPVCGNTAPPGWVTGPFRGGSDVEDTI